MKSFSKLLCQSEVRIVTYEEPLKGMKTLYSLFWSCDHRQLEDIFPRDQIRQEEVSIPTSLKKQLRTCKYGMQENVLIFTLQALGIKKKNLVV